MSGMLDKMSHGIENHRGESRAHVEGPGVYPRMGRRLEGKQLDVLGLSMTT